MTYVIVFAVLIVGGFWLLRSLIRRTVTLSWLLLAGIILVALVLGGLFRLVPNFSLAGLFGWWTAKGFWAGLVLLVGLAVSWVLGRWQRQ